MEINEGENISVCIAGCLLIPERIEYMEKSISSFVRFLPKAEYWLGLDRGIGVPDGWLDQFPVDINVNVHNRGLGHSWNWGYKNATKKFILHSEEDWAVLEPQNFQKIFSGAMDVVDKHDGIFRFDNMCQDFWKPGWTPQREGEFDYFQLNRPPNLNGWNLYYYSNRPHLRRNGLSGRLGLWNPENVPPPDVETQMCRDYYGTNQPVNFFNRTLIGHIGTESIRNK